MKYHIEVLNRKNYPEYSIVSDDFVQIGTMVVRGSKQMFPSDALEPITHIALHAVIERCAVMREASVKLREEQFKWIREQESNPEVLPFILEPQWTEIDIPVPAFAIQLANQEANCYEN